MLGRIAGGLAVFVVALLLVATPAPAIDLGEWVPGLKVSPFISERVEYESNVFQAPSNAQDDVVSKTIPGILVDYSAGPNSFSFGYRAEILRWADLESQDTEHHFVVAQIKLDYPKWLFLARDDFSKTSDPPGTELTGRIESTTNVLAPEFEYRLTERFSVGANYSWTTVDFEQTVDQLDRDEHLIGGSVFWKFLPRADLSLTYNYGEKNFDTATSRDVTRNLVLVGVRGDLTAKLSAKFRLGYESREPEQSGLADYNGLVFGGDWTYKPTERTKISLLLDRSVQESTFASSFFYVSTTGTLLLEHEFMPKLSANLRLTGGNNDYPTKESVGGSSAKFRNDDLLGWGAGVVYDIQKWLRVGLEYSHTRRDSNFDTFDFADDKVAGTVTLQF